jgi:polysaccharide biosynthesis/export protein
MILHRTCGARCAPFFVAFLGFAFTQPLAAQRATPGQTPAPPSLLAKENASRVAASAEQIRAVLVKDPGLLVELKRYIAAEATSNGQIVEESDLSDQTIFERLGDDILFRAAATRLVQRYGYLLPALNPDSELGKQQELVLKQRARRLVQIEEQEDAEVAVSPKTAKTNDASNVQSTSAGTCDAQSEGNCSQFAPRGSRDNPGRPEPAPDAIPEPPINPSPMPQGSGSSLIQTRLTDGALSNGTSRLSDSSDFSLLALSNSYRDPSTLQSFGVDPSQLEKLQRSLRENDYANLPASDSMDSKSPAKVDASRSRLPARSGETSSDLVRDTSPGAIVHKSSPYSNIPSLYDLYVQVGSRDGAPQRFGVSILNSGARDSAHIPMDVPVGPDYVVGPGDGLEINLWGGVSQRLQRTVDREGRISLPESGPILVSGRTLGDVQLTIQQLLRTQFRDISTDVSLSRLRSVRVYVVGEVRAPGAYDVSSLSSALNALIAAGGVTEHGSLRSIKHFRGRQLIETVDAYDLLLRGVGSDQKRLEDGDSLLVPPVGPQVTIEGMVRRPAIYELRSNTSLEEALELSGGILPAAALKNVQVERLVAHEKRTMLSLSLNAEGSALDSSEQLRNFQVQDGDLIHIFPIAPYNEQAIYLQGHVLRPGRYSYHAGMTVSDLIGSYSDLLPEPSEKYAEIIRLNPPDDRPAVESFDLAVAIADPSKAPKLQPLDTVRIFARYDFEPAPEVYVTGEVRAPGPYSPPGQVHLRDAIFMAGGVSDDADLESTQIFRTSNDGTLKILSVNLAKALSGTSADNPALQPRDRILVHQSVAKVNPPVVYVKGDVSKPGRFPLTTNMHVGDLVRVAGGLNPSADEQSALLTHIAVNGQGTTEASSLNVNLGAAMAGEPDDNPPLHNGDVLTIRQNPGWNDLGASVTIRGEVVHPGTYGIHPGETLGAVLQKAGGFTPQAFSYGLVLTRREVREVEMNSHQQLIARMQAEEVQLKALPENDADQKNLKLTALAQTDTALTQLQTNLPVGRVVIHASPEGNAFESTADQTVVRNGDSIFVPKKPNYVLVQGQVFNATAVGYIQGRSANWYLGQAGGFTELADKKAAFVIRADGSVLAAKNNNGLWGGNPMDAVLLPGDAIVVPEKAPRIGNRNWAPLLQTAQIATSVVLAVAYLKP